MRFPFDFEAGTFPSHLYKIGLSLNISTKMTKLWGVLTVSLSTYVLEQNLLTHNPRWATWVPAQRQSWALGQVSGPAL